MNIALPLWLDGLQQSSRPYIVTNASPYARTHTHTHAYVYTHVDATAAGKDGPNPDALMAFLLLA